MVSPRATSDNGPYVFAQNCAEASFDDARSAAASVWAIRIASALTGKATLSERTIWGSMKVAVVPADRNARGSRG